MHPKYLPRLSPAEISEALAAEKFDFDQEKRARELAAKKGGHSGQPQRKYRRRR